MAAMAFIASRALPGLTKYKMCKLVFLADKYHLVRFGRPITGDRICAMEYGAVPSTTLDLLNAIINPNQTKGDPLRVEVLAKHFIVDRSFYNPHFKTRLEPAYEEILSQSDLDALQATIAAHGEKTFEELKSFTHEMFAFRKARADRISEAPDMRYEDLFAEDGDAIEGALEEMIEDDGLRKAFGSAKV